MRAPVECPVLVGRDDELRILEEMLAAAGDASGGMVALSGEAGIGKTRLVRELARAARTNGVMVGDGRAVPTGDTEPFRPLAEALLDLLRDRAFPDSDELRPWLPALGAMLPNVASDGATPGAGESVTARGEALLCLLRLLRTSDALVIVLEDLHWADADTLDVLEYLADNAADGRVLWVVTCRAEERCPAMDMVRRLHSRGHAQHLPLAPLDEDGVVEMAVACDPTADSDTLRRVQQVADGVPLLVEEVVASPGVPATVADTVRARLDGFSDDERVVVAAAAVIGTHFDWRMLPPTTGRDIDCVSRALERGVKAQILAVDGDRFRFRHALTREAIAGDLLPPRRSALAGAALKVIEESGGGDGAWRDVAADLAVQAGDGERAGQLLAESGRLSRERGALATAIGAWGRALELVGDPDKRSETQAALVEALAVAGRVDEAMAHGRRLIAELGEGGTSAARRAEVHSRLAQAAVDATRWSDAEVQIGAAKGLLAAEPSPVLASSVAVLEAEVALVHDEIDRARALADSAIETAEAAVDVRCHAFELIGRCERIRDLDTARQAFQQAVTTAEGADLPIWRLRALQELGTIEMFERGGGDRLREARAIAGEVGAQSTAAVLDVQLAAVNSLHFDVDAMTAHARSAVDTTERLGLGDLKATALCFLAESHGHAREFSEMERWLARAAAAAPDNPEIEAFAWGCRAHAALLNDDQDDGFDALERSVQLARKLPQSPPGLFRGLWPIVLAARDQEGAQSAIDEVRDGPAGRPCWNRALIGYADAIMAGRAGQTERADEMTRTADVHLASGPVWLALSRTYAASVADADGWGRPQAWLESARTTFAEHGLDALAHRCTSELGGDDRLERFGITTREADVLELVTEGLPNKEIAAQLGVSPRTVEKHVESLLRKTAARSRTHLIAVVGSSRPR